MYITLSRYTDPTLFHGAFLQFDIFPVWVSATKTKLFRKLMSNIMRVSSMMVVTRVILNLLMMKN